MFLLYQTVFAGLLGLAFGSFLNVCLTRWPADESIVNPGSHCRNCPRSLSWWENIPLMSWLALRGRCRTCKSWIGWRYPLVDSAVAGLWAFLAWRHMGYFLFNNSIFTAGFEGSKSSLEIPVIGLFVFSWLLIGLAVLDAEHLWLPDFVTLPGIGIGLIWRLSIVFLDYHHFRRLPLKDAVASTLSAAVSFTISILAAAALVLLIRWTYWLIRHREGIGLGDAKLMAMLAAWLGFSGALLSFVVGVVLGAFVGLILLAVPKDRRIGETWALTKLPLGTFLCIGGIVSSLWGDRLIAAYLHWAGL